MRLRRGCRAGVTATRLKTPLLAQVIAARLETLISAHLAQEERFVLPLLDAREAAAPS